MSDLSTKYVEVCSNCLRASCWYGIFMCDEAINAGTVVKTVDELHALGRENEEYWTDAYLAKMYGPSSD